MFLIGVWKKSFYVCAPALVWGVTLFVASLYLHLIKRELKKRKSLKIRFLFENASERGRDGGKRRVPIYIDGRTRMRAQKRAF